MTAPPQAARHPHEHVAHGVRRPDPYAWLRDVASPEVRDHLVAERAWYDVATGHLASLVTELRSESRARTPPTETSVGWRRRNRSYYTHLPAEREYAQLLRDLHTDDASAPRDRSNSGAPTHVIHRDVLLDGNALAGPGGHLDLGLTLVSPDDRFLAYSVDVVGDEVYRLRFRDLDTGRDLDDEVPRTYYGGAWSADARFFFYTVHDPAYRPFQVWRHRLGTSAGDDVLVLEERDPRFAVEVRETRSGGLVVIWSASRDTTEVWVVDTAAPTEPPRSVGGRRRGVEYHAEHLRLADGGEWLLLVTNDGATEFRLAGAPVPRSTDQDHTAWVPVLPEVPAERLERVDAFAHHVVLSLRRDGRHLLRVLPTPSVEPPLMQGRTAPHAGSNRPSFEITPTFDAGTVFLAPTGDYETSVITVADSSYIHPTVWSDVDLATGVRRERHRNEAPGHDPDAYLCEVREFPAPDGTPVPATLVRRRDTPLDGTAPALLYGYGAYESTDEPEWDPALLSLVDRGVIYVHAHVRGGGEGGRSWWLEGRLEHKQNTFNDHVAVADGLAGAATGTPLVDPGRMVTRGLSAGGLLQGVVFSQRPDRWRAVVAEVPFVDVVTTMFDESVPLTANEWDEWGDPRREEEFRWMLAYSPYDNLPPASRRPDLLVTGALHDPRVMVSEPAKWVAALRHSDPDWSPRCVFRCEVGAGAHTGPAGRFAHLAYEAEVHAWVLDRLGLLGSS